MGSERHHHLAAWLGDRPLIGPPVIFVEGMLGHSTAASLDPLLANLWGKTPGPAALDLTDLHLQDAEGTAALMDLIRARRNAGFALTLIGAPQGLRQGLHRTGLLDCPNPIRLVSAQQDEPST